MKKAAILTLLLFLLTSGIAFAQQEPDEHKPGIYYTILDASTGQNLLETGIRVEVDDQLITDDNKLYRVSHIDGYTAYAHFVQDESASISWTDLTVPAANGAPAGKLISIYHSHTDEAFRPTDGKASIRGNGSIMKVGEVFAEKLRSLGYTVNHDKTLHDPHDANAYIRSRRTAAKLLGEQPTALFDIHRNSAPAALYKMNLNGEQIAKIVIVVGRANPLMPTTLNYAKKLKASSDAKYPKLVRGIFFARGHYNQDISPRSILIEVGTEGSTLAEAQKGISYFADAIPGVLGGPQDPAPGGATAQAAPPSGGNGSFLDTGDAAWKNILWIVGLTAAGGMAYLYISAGSWGEVRKKLTQFRNIEFANLLGFRSRRRDDRDKE